MEKTINLFLIYIYKICVRKKNKINTIIIIVLSCIYTRIRTKKLLINIFYVNFASLILKIFIHASFLFIFLK